MERIFGELEQGGVRRGDLVLAWSFTVASQRSLSERLLHLRDTAFASLGDAAPSFTVDSTQDVAGGPSLRVVRGTFRCLLSCRWASPATVLNYGPARAAPRR